MKPKNFPARKLARQVSARARIDGVPGATARYFRAQAYSPIIEARTIRSKKRRDC